MSSDEKSTFSGSLKGRLGLFKRTKSPSPEKRSSKSPNETISTDQLLELESPPLTPLTLTGYSKSTRNRLLSTELGEEIRNLLPARLQIESNWELLYSLEEHGASLNTLYHNSKKGSVSTNTGYDKSGYLLVVKDEHNGIFGGYANEYFHTTELRRYYGNGECFLWKSKVVKDEDGSHVQFQAFPYTGLNDFLIYSTSQFLSIGGGNGQYGIWVDRDLIHGVSNPSLTFGNEPLSPQGEKFGILGVEIWRV